MAGDHTNVIIQEESSYVLIFLKAFPRLLCFCLNRSCIVLHLTLVPLFPMK